VLDEGVVAPNLGGAVLHHRLSGHLHGCLMGLHGLWRGRQDSQGGGPGLVGWARWGNGKVLLCQSMGYRHGHEASWLPGACLGWSRVGFIVVAAVSVCLQGCCCGCCLCGAHRRACALLPIHTKKVGECSAVMHGLRCLLVRLPWADCTEPDAIGTAASPTCRDFAPL
jgi:hypothetical protein